MAYLDQYTLAQDADFVARVTMAVTLAAVNLYNDPGSGHAKRQYCVQVLASPSGHGARFAYGVTADETITAESSDAVIFNRVAGIFSAYAGG